jgi:outer membrane protein
MRLFSRAAVLVLVASLLPASGRAQQPLKLAYINSQQILAQAPGRAEAEAQYEREAGTYRQQVQRMGDSLTALIAAYDKEAVTLSPTAKETRQKAIRDRESSYQRRAQELEQRMGQRQQELVQPIMDKVQQAINDIHVEEGYAMVFDAAAAAPVLVAADKSLDITDKVLARLRSTASAAPATKPAAAQRAPAGVRPPKP